MKARGLLDRLAAVGAEQRKLGHERRELVEAARAVGITWARIGAALGVSAQAAHQEHRRARPLLPLR